MDNIIEIVVFFFIVYSILSAFIGKKKKSQNRIPGNATGDVQQKTSPSRESIETLENLFGFKLPKTEDEYSNTQRKPSYGNLENSSWDPEKEFHKKISERDSLWKKNIEKKMPHVNYDKATVTVSSSKRKSDEKNIKVIPAEKLEYRRADEIRKKLIGKSSLSEIILLSEIIDKPKALRR